MKHFKSLLFVLLSSLIITSSPLCASNLSVDLSSANATENNADEKANDSKADSDKGFEIKVIDLHCDGGDSSLITMDGTNILIDAGGTSNSASYIYDAIKDLKSIDYMIFTHADSDHIINFSNPAGIAKWVNEGGRIGTLIDFDNEYKEQWYSTSGIYQAYKLTRDLWLSPALGYIKEYHSAYDCVNQINGGKPFYKIGKSGNGMRILDNYFYKENAVGGDSANRNLLSVCTLFTYDGKKALFTGDIEEYDSGRGYKRCYGETFLTIKNYKYLKDGVDFYKTAHHGSNTSNSCNIIDVIRPRFVAISGAATKIDTTKNKKFPGENTMINVGKWTDYIYTTSIFEDEQDDKSPVNSLYGDIICKYDFLKKDLKFTSSELEKGNIEQCAFIEDWCFSQRFTPMNIYNLSEYDRIGNGIIFNFKKWPKISNDVDYKKNVEIVKNAFDNSTNANMDVEFTNCTYIKIGHIDILANYGNRSGQMSYNCIKKIDALCNDHVLDYLIVSNYSYECLSGLIDNQGLFKKGHIKEVTNFMHFGKKPFTFDGKFEKTFNEMLKSPAFKKTKEYTSSQINGEVFNLIKNDNSFSVDLRFLNMPFNDDMPATTDIDFRTYSLGFNIEVKHGKDSYIYTNFGSNVEEDTIKNIYKENKIYLKDVDHFEMMNHFEFRLMDKSIASSIKKSLKAMGNPELIINGALDETFDYYAHGNQQIVDLLYYTFMNSNILGNTVYDPSDYGYKNKPYYQNVNTRILFGRDYRQQNILAQNFQYTSDVMSEYIIFQ